MREMKKESRENMQQKNIFMPLRAQNL